MPHDTSTDFHGIPNDLHNGGTPPHAPHAPHAHHAHHTPHTFMKFEAKSFGHDAPLNVGAQVLQPRRAKLREASIRWLMEVSKVVYNGG